jgi:dienelactone hydrolase
VRRVRLGAAPRTARPGVPPRLWRVELTGWYPPRALRYLLEADGELLAYGFPAPGQRSLHAVTADPAVLSGAITARYEGGAAGAQAPPPTGATPHPGARRGDPQVSTDPGPFAVRRDVYDFGDRAVRLPGLDRKVELRADVHHPRGLPGGPFPLVLLLHGNHGSCYRADRTHTRFEWPCRRGWRPLPNHRGYDYIARRLASFGYVVASVSANGVNVHTSLFPNAGARQRGELLERHLDLWRRWAIAGGDPFGTRFVGKVDLDRIGTMGHSRGGEGAVWQPIVDRERAEPYGIDAVLAIAPTDITRRTLNRVPLAVVLPYCDGDVSDLQGVHFFDDARYRVPGDPTPKHTVTVFGANHNFFNTVWSPGGAYPDGFDDASEIRPCRGRLTQAEQRRVGAVYVVRFFRRYLGNELSLDPIWTGARTAANIAPERALLSYLAPPQRRLDLDRFSRRRDLYRNNLGGEVRPAATFLYRWCPDTFEARCVRRPFSDMNVHEPGLARAVVGWRDRGARVRFELPAGLGDVGGFDALQFRAAVNPGYEEARSIRRQDLTVQILDGAGNRASVAAAEVGAAPLVLPPLRFVPGCCYAGKAILNQVRFPLQRFEGVDLSDVRAVVLRFSRTDRGVIDVADLAFTRGIS